MIEIFISIANIVVFANIAKDDGLLANTSQNFKTIT
jgi:hypothetical protein